MTEIARLGAVYGEKTSGENMSGEQAAVEAATTSRNALEFIFGAQRAMLEEMMLATGEMFDRIRTEMHLFSELASKLAEAHSVNNFQTMGDECSRHQIEFLRRESERIFKHGERLIEANAKLMSNWRKY